jgi:outer membrane protein assembly factor BamB
VRNHSPHRRVAAALVVTSLLAVAAACSSDDAEPIAEDPERPSGPVAVGDEVVPPEVAQHAADWPLPGRDHANSRAATDSPIDTGSVDRLEVVWTAPLPGSGAYGSASTTPLVLGDLVVIQDLRSNVRAFELTTGEPVWETLVDEFQIGPNGVAVGWGRVFATKGMEQVMALDVTSGEELWSVEITDTPTAGIDIQPQVAAGLVLVSTVPISLDGFYTGGDRGVLHALDAETGEVVWRFDTVADDLWGDPAVNSGGGSWYPPAVDPEAEIVYWGIANPAPFPGTPEAPNGASRPGPNLYTESVVALDLRTGELLWHHQVFEHDLLDRDHVHTMLVQTDEGVVLVSTGKGGVVVGHDAAAGGELWRTPVGIHRNDDLEALDGTTEVWPGTFGGVITPPAHADGVVYVATLNAPTDLSPAEPAYLGSELGTAPGEVAAVRASDGELLWSTEVPGDPLGGATVVGDLVFTATFQGTMFALRRDTGEIVWERDAGGGVNGWPAAAGGLLLWPVGMADPPVLVALGLDDG